MRRVLFLSLILGFFLFLKQVEVNGQVTDNEESSIKTAATKPNATTISQAEQAASIPFSDSRNGLPYSSIKPRPKDVVLITINTKFVRESYATTIKLLQVSFSNSSSGMENFRQRLIIGLNKPYYNFKKEILIIGNFDFKLDGTLFGITNTALVTMKYNFRRSYKKNNTYFELIVDNLIFKIGIPFTLY
jgi:hypothetical protein